MLESGNYKILHWRYIIILRTYKIRGSANQSDFFNNYNLYTKTFKIYQFFRKWFIRYGFEIYLYFNTLMLIFVSIWIKFFVLCQTFFDIKIRKMAAGLTPYVAGETLILQNFKLIMNSERLSPFLPVWSERLNLGTGRGRLWNIIKWGSE